jgi:tetratricopeptide (TPR) repeat protein
MSGFFAMMVGKAQEARAWLKAASQQAPQAALPRALLAQINLAQNRKNAAQTLADQALERNPGSPAAQVTMALVNISSFDLKAARRHLEKAIRADPRFVAAYVYLTKIWLGSDYLRRARHTIEAALRLAPREAQVLSMAGFVRLAFRDYQGAKRYFNQAIKANPGFGDPHLGLGYYHFRYRAFNRGLEEIYLPPCWSPGWPSSRPSWGRPSTRCGFSPRPWRPMIMLGPWTPKTPRPISIRA